MDYYQGYEDAMRQARVTRSTGLFWLLSRMIISLLYCAFIYVPLILLGYLVANKMSSLYSNDSYIKVGLVIIIAYLIFAFVYFLKGVLIGSRNNGRIWWLLVWIICIAITCGVQSLIGQELLERFFESRQIANYLVWSWVGAIAIGTLIYSHYQFLTNIAPSVTFWSYNAGFKLVKKSLKATKDDPPHKSSSYFQNTGMQVTFRRDANSYSK